MNTKSFFMVAISVFVLASCNLNQVNQTGLLTASVRGALHSPATLSIADEIESVEYIPLEMTSDNASLIDGVVDFAITSKYIYVLVGMTDCRRATMSGYGCGPTVEPIT